MLEIRGLKKSYGKKPVLAGVDLTVPDGAVFGLVGINGAGKTTLLRLIADVLRPRRRRDLAGRSLRHGQCGKAQRALLSAR